LKGDVFGTTLGSKIKYYLSAAFTHLGSIILFKWV